LFEEAARVLQVTVLLLHAWLLQSLQDVHPIGGVQPEPWFIECT
jgi:hypothetical protein